MRHRGSPIGVSKEIKVRGCRLSFAPPPLPRTLFAAAAAFAGVALFVTGVATPQGPKTALQGVYDIDVTASDDIGAAVARGTAQMNFAIRPLARHLIAKANPPYRRIVLTKSGATATIKLDGGSPIETPLDGTWVRWIREDGGIDRITGQWSDRALLVYFRADDGARTQKYVLDADGLTLQLHVELTSPRLPSPIDYTLVYRRH